MLSSEKLLAVYKKLDARINKLYDQVSALSLQKGPQGPKGEKGDKGERGLDGRNGRDGRDGKDGPKGDKGKDGVNGKDGVSVVDAGLDFDNVLRFELSNGDILEAGQLDFSGSDGYKVIGMGSSIPAIVSQLYTGTGSPEGVVVANPGSLYLNSAGGLNTTLYVKESGTGSTGWAAK